MLEPDEFEFYELLDAYKERFGSFPPTHQLSERKAMELIRKALETNCEIVIQNAPQRPPEDLA